MHKTTIVCFFLLGCIATLPSYSHADGLSDLTRQLQKLQGRSPIMADYQRSFTEINYANSKKYRKELTGEVALLLSDGPDGLQVTYNPLVLDNFATENLAKTADEDADTPTLNGVRGIDADQLSRILSASSSLLRLINLGTFEQEQATTLKGKPARQLTFSLPLKAILEDKKSRKYVKKFQGSYDIFIDEAGVPLETRTNFTGRGRAFIVLSVTAEISNRSEYQVVKQRLVRVYNEYANSFTSTFGDSQSSGVNRIEIR